EPPEVTAYTSAGESAGPSGQVDRERAIAADWWTLFASPSLNGVMDQALAGNRTLAAARSSLDQAGELVREARGGFYPRVDVTANAQRQKTNGSRTAGINSAASSGSSPFNLYSLGPTFSFAPDVFGLARRQVEQQQALAENQGYQLAAAWLTLTGNVVLQAVNIASANLQLEALDDVIVRDSDNLALVQRRYAAGKVARSDVLTAESQLASDRTLLPPVRQEQSVARHALTLLAGQFPSDWSPPDFALADFRLPADLPVGLPSELVRRRPDILAAEAQLHAASAAVGVAVAGMYPSLTLSGSTGLAATSSAALFRGSSRVWELAAGLTAPLFAGGALEARKDAAVAAFEASLATYQQTVFAAFGQVADTLQALQNDGALLAAQQAAVGAAGAARDIQRITYTAGKSDLLGLLAAERAYQQARLGYARVRAQHLQDTAQLLVAVGGGWWNSALPGHAVADPAR
ncbi:MAG: efflux transporter outer membrane subunit, partial [Gammaproteobacteria bacterium]